MHCGIWDWCMVAFVRWVICACHVINKGKIRLISSLWPGDSVHENHRTFPMARPKCLMRDFTNLNRIYKAHWTNVWWIMKVFQVHCGDAIWRHRTKIWVDIGSGNGLLPDGTKPLPEPMLTYHMYGPMTFIWGQIYLSHWPLKSAWKLLIWNLLWISQGPMS